MNESDTSFWRSSELSGLELLRASRASFSYPKHSHNAYSIGVVESGVSVNNCCGKKQYSAQDAIILINPDEAHTGYTHSKYSSYRMLYVTENAMKTVLEDGQELPKFKNNVVYNAMLAAKIIGLHQNIETGGEAIFLQERFSSTMLELIAKYSGGAELEEKKEHAAVQKVKEYLEEQYSSHISVDDLAELSGLNRAYLMRVFHKQVGISIYSYLLQQRIEAAKTIMLNSQSSVETALQLGFADQSHFIRSFKKLTGSTPYKFVKKSLLFNK